MKSIFPFEADAYNCHKTAILFTYHGILKENQYRNFTVEGKADGSNNTGSGR
jgi:hypothetical protein